MSTRKRPPKTGLSHAVAHPAVKHARIRSLLTRPLGLLGWEKLEPVLLAALTTREPLLLIGRHGTAKSFLLERLAQALGLIYRFYNASLINYDDLVGCDSGLDKNLTENSPRLSPMAVTKRKTKKLPADS